jgi:Sulfotransferase domain
MQNTPRLLSQKFACRIFGRYRSSRALDFRQFARSHGATRAALRNLARHSLTSLRGQAKPVRRVAIVSSPRSGNSWVRCVLADVLGLEQIFVHNYFEAPLILPDNCILQLHWYREPNFQEFLRSNRFRVVVVARHPLDMLLSTLHFARLDKEANLWLGGNAEFTPRFLGAAPASPEFLEYATGWGAENLLSITHQWWHDQQAIKVRYEDFVQDPVSRFKELITTLDGSPANLSAALQKYGLAKWQAKRNKHGWQGRPGLWQDLIPFDDALQIYERHRGVFDGLAYSIGRTSLTREEALRNWQQMKVDPPKAQDTGVRSQESEARI